MNKTRIVCALHRLAVAWAEHHGIAADSYVTVTRAGPLKGIPANTEVIVVDTPYKFEDSRTLNAALKRLTNVRHVTLAIG